MGQRQWLRGGDGRGRQLSIERRAETEEQGCTNGCGSALAVAWLSAPKLRLMVDVEKPEGVAVVATMAEREGEREREIGREGASMLQHLVADLATLSHDLKISSWRQVIKTNVTGKQLALLTLPPHTALPLPPTLSVLEKVATMARSHPSCNCNCNCRSEWQAIGR